MPELPKKETPPVIVPEIKATEPVEEKADIRQPEQEAMVIAPKADVKPVHIPVMEPMREAPKAHKVINEPVISERDDALDELFDLPRSEDLSGRSTHVPIASIESALGLNARIFTLNELFGGDRTLFDTTCQQLNDLTSFQEARSLLMAGPARTFKWADQSRIKMAEDFIRIVARRYPKT
jgi:hypothetical protein